MVNATFWLGAIIGSLASLFLLNTHAVAQNAGWRYAFGIGAVLGVGVLFLRLRVPESPRWLMLRGRDDEANTIVCGIEEKVAKGKKDLPAPEGDKLKLKVRDHTPWKEVFRSMLKDNRQRSLLALVLMVGQSFFFNSVFFTYGLVVKKFYNVSDQMLPLHLLPFAIGCFFGPLFLGKLFDTIGRKPMIAATYGISGALLLAIIYPFTAGMLSATGLDIGFSIIFFVASSAASAAFLTVSEIFPLEIRAFTIAIFYAIGTLIGGVAAPVFFGVLINTGSKGMVSIGYAIGAALMILGAGFELKIGVEAAGKSLESISKPLQSS
jgi:MFS family permease